MHVDVPILRSDLLHACLTLWTLHKKSICRINFALWLAFINGIATNAVKAAEVLPSNRCSHSNPSQMVIGQANRQFLAAVGRKVLGLPFGVFACLGCWAVYVVAWYGFGGLMPSYLLAIHHSPLTIYDWKFKVLHLDFSYLSLMLHWACLVLFRSVQPSTF